MVGNVKAFESKYINPEESRRYMRNIWQEEEELMREIISVLVGIHDDNPTDIFYYDVIPVVPPNVRPVMVVFVPIFTKRQLLRTEIVIKPYDENDHLATNNSFSLRNHRFFVYF